MLNLSRVNADETPFVSGLFIPLFFTMFGLVTRVICCAVLVALSRVSGECPLTVMKCNDKDPDIVYSVTSNGTCISPGVAAFFTGDFYELDFNFKPGENAARAISVVTAEVFGMVIPLFIVNPDACKTKELKCPLQSGYMYNYKPAFNVGSSLTPPKKVKARVTWRLLDENLQAIFCIKANIVVSPKVDSHPIFFVV